MQVEAGGGVRALICSTMVEVWQVAESALVEEGLVDDANSSQRLLSCTNLGPVGTI